LIDINGMLEAPVAGGSLRVAGRYGYPGPVLNLVNPDAELAYWDYQTQLSLPISAHDRVELSWFGSYDRAGSRSPRLRVATVTLEFHRAELRVIRDLGDFELGSALQFGYERSEFEGGLHVHATRIGPRLWAQWRGKGGLRLRVGADMFGSVGDMTSPIDQDDAVVEIAVPPYAANVAARSVMGAYAELSWPVHPKLRFDLGLRADLWLTGTRAEAAADPRATISYRSHPGVEWHVAAGLGHQPAVFLIPLPGIADVGLSYGLQQAIQTEAGVAFMLPEQLRLETQFYVQYLTDVILPDLVLEQSENCNSLPPEIADSSARCIDRYPRANALAYGAEVFLHRASSEPLSGWLSYTLGWAEGYAAAGFTFTPSFDVRHLINLVLNYKFGGGFSAGTRLHFRSGKMASETFLRDGPIRYEQRLPGFFRADVQLGYAWSASWADLKLSLEWWNLTLAREATGIQCLDGVLNAADPLRATPCRVTRAPGLFLPNLGLRAVF
jgi:outer membrane receptor protein involved in Fe transport